MSKLKVELLSQQQLTPKERNIYREILIKNEIDQMLFMNECYFELMEEGEDV